MSKYRFLRIYGSVLCATAIILVLVAWLSQSKIDANAFVDRGPVTVESLQKTVNDLQKEVDALKGEIEKLKEGK